MRSGKCDQPFCFSFLCRPNFLGGDSKLINKSKISAEVCNRSLHDLLGGHDFVNCNISSVCMASV